jgi:enterochelin esterase-like enzyme
MATDVTPPTLTACDQEGTIGLDRVTAPTQGFDIGFSYYLPPCYEELTNVRFPVIYLLTMPFETSLSATDQTPMSLADRLIRSGRLPPAIIIVPDDIIDYGYHAALAKDLIPYVDGKFRTLASRRYRGVGGISHGAAIAVRMAFEFPAIFGSAGLLSGGIDASEKERFEAWIAQTPVEQRPRVLINVGEQDGIRALTSNLLEVLDRNEFPYTLQLGQGDHSWEYWSAQMESYLLWFADAW